MKARFSLSFGFALIEIIVVLALLLIVAGAYYGLSHKGEKNAPAKSIPAKAIEKAHSVECQSNLQQIRQMIQMEAATGEGFPARIDQGATASISRCPVSGQPYSYDPQTGRVWCSTPGHERY